MRGMTGYLFAFTLTDINYAAEQFSSYDLRYI